MSTTAFRKCRDPDYYLKDGDIVIEVDNTLFRIHKAHLKKEPSAFSDMFALGPTPGRLIDGSGDDQPLTLSGDTLDEFRALCWIMYALPGDITSLVKRRLSDPEISRFLSLSLIAHKYQFVHLEVWASGFIDSAHCVGPNPNPRKNKIFLDTCSTDDLLHLHRYGLVSDKSGISTIAMQEIRKRLKGDSLMDPLYALQVSEGYGLRAVQGEAYYRILCDACRSLSNVEHREIISLATFHSRLPKELSDTHKSRLVQGYFTLLTVHDQVFKKLPYYREHVEERYIAVGELTNVGSSRKVTVDILGRLEQVARHAPPMNVEIQKMVAQVQAELPDYFLGQDGDKLASLQT